MLASAKRLIIRLPGMRRVCDWYRENGFAESRRRQVFRRHFQENYWRSEESRSGRGSSLEQTAALRSLLPALLGELDVRSLLDIPCGDFHWLSHVPLPLDRYVGADVVPELIARNQRLHGQGGREFVVRDAVSDRLPACDLILCRDLLVHLSLREAALAIENFRASGASWLLATSFPATEVNRDIARGDWRPLNLTRAPFFLPPPARSFNEGCTEDGGRYADKSLCLWHLPSLAQSAKRVAG